MSEADTNLPTGKRLRQQQVLHAAESAIRLSGDVTFSMRQLASDAGVAFKTPFNLFGNKENILQSLMEARLREQAEDLRAALEREDPVSNLFGIASRSCRVYLADSELYRPIIRSIGVTGSNDLREQAVDLWRTALRVCEKDGLLAAGVDIDPLAKRIQASFLTSLTIWANGYLDDIEVASQVLIGVGVCISGKLTPEAEKTARRCMQPV